MDVSFELDAIVAVFQVGSCVEDHRPFGVMGVAHLLAVQSRCLQKDEVAPAAGLPLESSVFKDKQRGHLFAVVGDDVDEEEIAVFGTGRGEQPQAEVHLEEGTARPRLLHIGGHIHEKVFQTTKRRIDEDRGGRPTQPVGNCSWRSGRPRLASVCRSG